ncbi:MAG TPA: 4'-phosphopantetheinyl transferase superfamily protein [Solirubrobacteraceae bacterium]|nr:4'-phosphopantetheinyl transferase superfamily protein [Solirubrobacteraceae bacterium]
MLSPQERARAAARRAERDRRRFIADHGWRRRLLAEHVGCRPDGLAFVENEQGKPRLATGGPRFSASRCDEIAWYAVCAEREVGVDVERIDADRPLQPLARRLLTARERSLYEALPDIERARALAAGWACKEAAFKALGTGLVFPLTRLEAWTPDGTPTRAEELEIRELEAGEGRVAAVAVRVEPAETVAVAPLRDLSDG